MHLKNPVRGVYCRGKTGGEKGDSYLKKKYKKEGFGQEIKGSRYHESYKMGLVSQFYVETEEKVEETTARKIIASRGKRIAGRKGSQVCEK